jgi:hypothetical protein
MEVLIMILFAFVLFAILIAAWLAAPAGTEEKALQPAQVPVLKVGDARA